MAHLSVKHFSPLRKSFSPSRRHWRHLASRSRAIRILYMRRRFGGRQPLWGTGVTSAMLVIFRPSALSARTADSRPGPGPLMRTSTFFTPHSCAARPACSAATCAANGVDLREPLKPAAPEVAQASALPCRSVIVMMVLLNEAWTCAMPSATFFFTFLRTRAAVVGAAGGFAMSWVPIPFSAGLRGRNVDLDGRLSRSLAGTGVGAGALSAHGQALAMARAAVAAQVDQALDVDLHFATQVPFDRELGDLLAQSLHVGLRQVLDLRA